MLPERRHGIGILALMMWKPTVLGLTCLFFTLSAAHADNDIGLTNEEKAYIAASGPITMCVDPDWEPFERITPQGQHEGIAADLVTLVAQRVGLKIELYPTKDWEDSLAA